jgi:hypothetical protein
MRSHLVRPSIYVEERCRGIFRGLGAAWDSTVPLPACLRIFCQDSKVHERSYVHGIMVNKPVAKMSKLSIPI